MGHRDITYAPEDTEIRAGVGIGPYRLGMPIGELDNMLMAPDEREELPLHTRIKAGAFMFWIDRATGNLSQILVGQGFTGRFLDKIGIGSTLADVIAVAGDIEEEVDVYVLPDHPGICFELADADDWNELTAPIEAISVYPPDLPSG